MKLSNGDRWKMRDVATFRWDKNEAGSRAVGPMDRAFRDRSDQRNSIETVNPASIMSARQSR